MSEVTRIYVACLAAYNNGMLHGVWIDAAVELDVIQNQINDMLSSSPIENAEEYAIHDFEGFEGYRLSEYEGIQAVHQISCFINEHGKIAAELLSYFSSIKEAQEAIDESFAGCYNSVADFAAELTEQSTEIPESLAYYIDYEKMGRDLEYSGDIFTIEAAYREVHVFWSR